MTRYFNNAPAHFARMGGQRGAQAVAVAATRSMAPALSYLAPLRVPPPHPALFIAVGLAIAFTLWRQSQQQAETVPNPALSPFACNPNFSAYGTLIEDCGLFYEQTHTSLSGCGIINYTPNQGGCGVLPNAGGFRNLARTPPAITIPPNREIKVKRMQMRSYFGTQHVIATVDRLRNTTAESVPATVETPAAPGRTVPLPTLPQTWASPYPTAPSRPIQVTTLPPATVAVPVRGFGVNVQTGAAVAPMWPVKEMKAAASAATMRVISQTFGQMGEAVDFTRCLMGAIGNTYSARTVDYYSTTGHRVSAPVEKAIPKWQWGMALETLAQGGEGAWIKPKNYRDYVRFKDGVFVHPSGRSVTAAEAAERFAKCLILEWWSDRVAAEQSKILRDIGRKFGLMAGPFGVETLWTLAQGGVPYEGLFNLGLTPTP